MHAKFHFRIEDDGEQILEISECYSGLSFVCEVGPDLHVAHRDGSIEVWTVEDSPRLLFSGAAAAGDLEGKKAE